MSKIKLVITSSDPAMPEFISALGLWLSERRYNTRVDGFFIYILEGSRIVVIECYLYTIKCPNIVVEWYDPESFSKVQQSIEEKLAEMRTWPTV